MNRKDAASRTTHRDLQMVDGRPVLATPAGPVTALYSDTFPDGMHRRNRQMAAAGVECFMLVVRGGFEGDWFTSWFWRDDGVYGDESDRADDLTLDRQAREIIAARPDALFMVRWALEVPKAWADKHPDELQCSSAKGRRREASYASRLAAEGRAEAARGIVRCVESMPWAERVVGYFPFGQDEGVPHVVSEEVLFDEAPVMVREFQTYLNETYESDAALREAWENQAVTLSTAAPPTQAEWESERRAWQHWPEPKKTRRYRDYFLCMRRLLEHQRRTELSAVRDASSRPVVVGTDALKQPMWGWLIQDAFAGRGDGMGFHNILVGAGSLDVGGILDAPELDALITPADYTARSCGFGFEPEGIGDSLVLRGKTIFVEDDARSWATNERDTQGAWRTPEECRAGLLRNMAVCASRGFIPYWMNVGRGFFDDPDVLQSVKEQIPVRRTLLSRPHRHTEHAIAMILDDTSALDEDFTAGFQNLAVLRQRTDHLALTGLPYRIYLFSDLERDDFPAFRAYLFPNLFRLTPERIGLIRSKCMRDGRVLVFGPGTGITDGRRLKTRGASDLLGFPLELVHKSSARRVLVHAGSHPASPGADAGPFTYGDSFPYGPILQPAADLMDSGAVELGKVSAWWMCNRAGLVLKEFGRGAANNGRSGARGEEDCAIAFSMAAPIDARVLRSLALYGGCVSWSDCGDIVAASDTMVAIHSVRSGTRTIRLPYAASVTDALTGENVANQCAQFEVNLGTPDTRVFILD